jgi:hypothetical protein
MPFRNTNALHSFLPLLSLSKAFHTNGHPALTTSFTLTTGGCRSEGSSERWKDLASCRANTSLWPYNPAMVLLLYHKLEQADHLDKWT